MEEVGAEVPHQRYLVRLNDQPAHSAIESGGSRQIHQSLRDPQGASPCAAGGLHCLTQACVEEMTRKNAMTDRASDV